MRALYTLIAAAIVLTPALAQGQGGNGGYGSPQNLNQPYQPSPPLKPMQSVTLDKITDPAGTLGSANVEDAKGVSVGQVKRVKTTPQGNVKSIDVALTATRGAEKIVALTARQLSGYMPASRIIRSKMTLAQIKRLPAVSPRSAGQSR